MTWWDLLWLPLLALAGLAGALAGKALSGGGRWCARVTCWRRPAGSSPFCRRHDTTSVAYIDAWRGDGTPLPVDRLPADAVRTLLETVPPPQFVETVGGDHHVATWPDLSWRCACGRAGTTRQSAWDHLLEPITTTRHPAPRGSEG